MKKLLLIIALGFVAQFMNAQNAPTSTFEGAVIIDKPEPGGIGLKVEGGRTWLHNDDNGAGSEVLDLGINKNWNWPTVRVITTDGGGWNSMRHYATRWGTNFSWSRGSNDGLQLMSTFGGADGHHGNYMFIYGNAPDTARVVKIALRTKNNSYINTNGNFGLGINQPTEKLDVNGGARIRDLPNGGDFVVTTDVNGSLMKQSYLDFLNVLTPLIGDNLGNHTATMDLDMDNFDIDDAFDVNADNDVNVGSDVNVMGNVGIGLPLIGGVPIAATTKLDVNGGVRFRNLPFADLPIVTIDGNGFLHESLYRTLDLLPDNLGNHCATKNLDMKGFDIVNVRDVNATRDVNAGNQVCAQNLLKVGDAGPKLEMRPEEIKGIGNLNMNAVGDINIHSGDFLHLTATTGITLDAPKNTNVGIGNAPDADVYLSVNGTTRIKDLPVGYFPVVTADATGKLHQWPIELLVGGDPGGGCDCDHLQNQIDELRNRIEQLENQ